MLNRFRLIVSLCLLLAISGCSLFSGKDKDAYRNSKSSKALEAPPELVIPPADSSYKVPEVVRASEIGAASAGTTSTTSTTAGVVPEYDNVSLEREGQSRWLHVKVSPEQVWQPLLDFWRDQDIKLEEVNRELGVMQTAWTAKVIDEMRGKVSTFFTKALSSAGGGDLKEQYKLRIEREAEGSNIYLSYQAMEKTFEELPSGESGASRWQVRPADPEPEAIMLKRIQQYLAKL